MNVSARERRLALAVGVLVLGVVLYFVVVRWAIPTWTRMRDEIAKKDEELRNLQALAATIEERQAEYDRRVRLALRYDTTAEAEQRFLNDLNALAKAASMTTPTIQRRSPKGESHYDVIRFTFTVKCTLAQFLAFMRHAYNHPGAHRIDTITIKPEGRYGTTDDNTLSVTMSISAVVIPEGGKKPAKKPGGKPA